jgi:DNA-binding NtrC family response regulator
LAEGDGMGVLQEAHRALPETPVIITTGHGSIASAVGAMKQGAFDYLTKPIIPDELLLVIRGRPNVPSSSGKFAACGSSWNSAEAFSGWSATAHPCGMSPSRFNWWPRPGAPS